MKTFLHERDCSNLEQSEKARFLAKIEMVFLCKQEESKEIYS